MLASLMAQGRLLKRLPILPTVASMVAIASITGVNVIFDRPAQAQGLTFQGTTSGQWGMPSNSSGSTFLSNNGGVNNRLTWGRVDNCPGCTTFTNYVQYDGLGFQTGVGSTFLLGNLSYRNGSIWDSFDGDFPLGISLDFTGLGLGTQNFSFLFNIFNSPNVTGNAVVDGDRLRFSNSGISSQTFTLGDTIYNLRLIGFSSDGGNSLVSEFNSPEGTTAYASLFGQIQSIGSIAPPPAPSPSPEPIVIVPSPEPIIPPIEIPPVEAPEAPWETPPEVPEPQTILGMILGVGFLVRTKLEKSLRK